MKYIVSFLLIVVLLVAPVAAVEFDLEYTTDQQSILSFGCFNDMIFAGTGNNGHIFYDSGSGWALANDTGEYGVRALYTYGEYMYAGTDTAGTIYRTNDGTTWDVANITTSDTIQCFAQFGAYLYAGGGYDDAKIYRSADGATWSLAYVTNETTIYDLEAFGSYLYMGTSANGSIKRSSTGLAWTEVEDLTDTHVWCLEEFNGDLYAGTGPNGKIYKSSDGSVYGVAYDSSELHIYDMEVFDGALYAVATSGVVYVTYDGSTWEEAYDTADDYLYAIGSCGDKLYIGSAATVGKIYSTTSLNASGGYGIQYPPHNVEFLIRDKYGKPLSGVTVLADPVSTTMGSWSWVKSLFGIDTSAVKIPSANMTGTTGSDGTISFVMFETIEYDLYITDASQGVSDTITMFPKNDMYVVTVATTDAPAEVDPIGKYVTYDLDAYFLNDTYVFLNFSWVDTQALTSYIWWNVTQSDGTVLDTHNLTPSGGATNASYPISLGGSDEIYTYKFEAYHPTYGWVNQSKSLADHKEITFGLSGTWKNFAAFALCALVALMFSRKSWKTGMFVTSVFAMVLAQVHILSINGSYANTMLVLTVFLVLSVVVLIRGGGDGSG